LRHRVPLANSFSGERSMNARTRRCTAACCLNTSARVRSFFLALVSALNASMPP